MGRAAWTLAILALSVLALPVHGQAPASHLQVTNNAFAAGWTGTGTPSDPYRPNFTLIAASGGYGIEIVNSNATVLLANLTISGGGVASDAIHLYNASNVTIVSSTFASDRIGIEVRDSRDITIANVSVQTSQVGAQIATSRNVTLRDDRFALNDKDVLFRQAAGNLLVNDNLSTATGQYGLWFDDNVSYDNDIDTSNVVNAMPIQWITNKVGGTISAPVVDLPRITNVAQIMVYNSTGVTLDHPSAKAGAANGIVVFRSRTISLVAPAAEGNMLTGVLVELSNGTLVSNASASHNNANGVAFQSSNANVVEWSMLQANAAPAIAVRAASNDTTLRQLTIASNPGGGVSAIGVRNVTIDNSSFTSDGGAEIALDTSRDVELRANTISGTGASGITIAHSVAQLDANAISGRSPAIAFTGSTGSNLTSNVIVLDQGATGLSFDGPQSYDNAIAPTNTVNATPVRWYTNVAGPVTLTGVRVEMPGITNVAQVMLYRASNVTLDAPIASNGTGAGIVAYNAYGANVSAGTIVGNALQGIAATQSPAVKVRGSTIFSNGNDGVALLSRSDAAMLENNVIAGDRGRGVSAATSGAVTLRGNAITGNTGAGIAISDTYALGAAAADHNTITSNAGGGIVATSANVGSFFSNNINGNGAEGIALSNVPAGATLQENTIVNHTRAIHLAAAGGAQILANAIGTNTGQYGVFFDDEASYNVTMPPTNLVNGAPMRWYVGDSAVTLSAPRMEVRGATNVAQIMLYKVANVTLANAAAANGTDRGIYVFRSANVTISQGSATNDSKTGIVIESSNDTRIDQAASSLNALDGIVVLSSPRATIDGASATNNTGRGFLLDQDVSPVLSNATSASNGGVGVVVSGGSGARLQDLVVRADRGGGIAIADTNASAGYLRRSYVESNGDVGIAISSSRLGEIREATVVNATKAIALASSDQIGFHDNAITIAPGQTGFWFADRASYNSTIDASNTVNGVPMAWYANLNGTALSDITVDLRGITNVAQVMVYQSRNVTLQRIHAANGTARGIYVLATNGTTIDASRADNDTMDGVVLESAVGSLAIANTTSRDNGGDGITATGDIRMDSVVAASDHGVGVRVSAGDLRFTSGLAASNLGGGVRVSAGGLALDRSTITGNGADGIHVDAGGRLLVANSTITGQTGAGVGVNAATSLNVTANTFAQNAGGGILADRAGDPQVSDNSLADDGPVGIHLGSTTGIPRVVADRLSNHTHGIELSQTEFGTFDANAITILPNQTGLWFSDERSYDNTITTANTVNGEAVHWFTTVAGTQTQPVVLSNVHSEVRGVTNVAQVMVFRSAYVDLPGLVASNGSARGLYLYASSSIRVEGANASGNGGAGVQLSSTQSSSIRNLTASGSAQGVVLTLSPNNVVSGVLAEGATVGVSIADATSRDDHVDRVEVNGTARGVTDAAWGGSSLLGNNVIVDAGAAKRVKVLGNLDFSDVAVTYRLDSDRIVSQTLSFGDQTADATSTGSTILRPTHAYATSGRYVATLTATTAGGLVLTDNVTVDVLPPLSAPRSLLAGAGSRNVTLSWTAPEFDGASAILHYRVYRDGAMVGETSGSSVGFVDTNLHDGTRYSYDVAAVNADGAGPNATATATPASPPSAPATPTATSRPNGAELSWGAPSDLGGLPLGGYYVLRSSNGSSFGIVATLSNVTNTTITGLTNGVASTFAVRAFNLAGTGPLSANATVTPIGPAGAPMALRALGGDASAVIVWGPPSDSGGTNVTSYHVWRGLSNDTVEMLPDSILPNTTSFRDTGLSNGRTYLYAVSATNAYGEGTRSALLNVTPAANDTLRPVVFAMDPPPGALLTASPENVSADYVDNDGIVVESVNVTLDAAPVVATATVTGFSYEPAAPLAIGDHTVSVRVRDPSGNEANETWTFRILATDELVARIEASNATLVPARAAPGDNVTASLSVRNNGYAEGNATFVVSLDGHALAYEDVALAPGESRDVFLSFAAPTVEGVYDLALENATLTLTVSATNATEQEGDAGAGGATSNDTAQPTPATPEGDASGRPARGHPPPRATPTGAAKTPGIEGALVIALVAAAALARKRR